MTSTSTAPTPPRLHHHQHHPLPFLSHQHPSKYSLRHFHQHPNNNNNTTNNTLFSHCLNGNYYGFCGADGDSEAWSPDGTCLLVRCHGVPGGSEMSSSSSSSGDNNAANDNNKNPNTSSPQHYEMQLFELPGDFYDTKALMMTTTTGKRDDNDSDSGESGIHNNHERHSQHDITKNHHHHHGDRGIISSHDSSSSEASSSSPQPPHHKIPICLSMSTNTTPIYSYKWNPKMTSSDPATCYFVTSLKGCRLILWDAFRNQCQKSVIRIQDYLNRPMDAYSLMFHPISAEYLFCGLNHSISIVPLERPHLFSSINSQSCLHERHLFSSIVSCMRYNKGPNRENMFAIGNYAGDVAWLDDRTNQVSGCVESARRRKGQQQQHKDGTRSSPMASTTSSQPLSGNGITQVQFSPCGNHLYAASRNDGFIHCWDIRNSSRQPLFSLQRDAYTNQAIGFDLTSHYLYTGSRGGHWKKYCISELAQEGSTAAFADGSPRLMETMAAGSRHVNLGTQATYNAAVNGVSIHPILPYVAICTGERRVHYRKRSRLRQRRGDDEDAGNTMSDDDSDSSSSQDEEASEEEMFQAPFIEVYYDGDLSK